MTSKKMDKIIRMSLCGIIIFMVIGVVVSVISSYRGISAQLAQGDPVKGNELEIINVFMSNSIQYFAFAVLFLIIYLIYISKSIGNSFESNDWDKRKEDLTNYEIDNNDFEQSKRISEPERSMYELIEAYKDNVIPMMERKELDITTLLIVDKCLFLYFKN